MNCKEKTDVNHIAALFQYEKINGAMMKALLREIPAGYIIPKMITQVIPRQGQRACLITFEILNSVNLVLIKCLLPQTR